MDRAGEILKYIHKSQTGIEIGPYFNPLAAKRAGYNCVVMDVFDAPTLRRQAELDPFIPKSSIENIEEVDIVGSCSALAELVAEKFPLGTFDYVISSHNLEHLPDPIRFLKGCELVLMPGGIVSMAVPDRRVCFDYFRPVTTLGSWLEAYFEKRGRPSEALIFDLQSLSAPYTRDGQGAPGFLHSDDPSGATPQRRLEGAYGQWLARRDAPDEVYRDCHCSVFTPSSLRLLLEDLRFLGLLKMEVIEVRPAAATEFYVHLRYPAGPASPIDLDAYYANRAKLLRDMIEEAAEASLIVRKLRNDAAAAAVVAPVPARYEYSRMAAFSHWLDLIWKKARRGRIRRAH